MKKIPNILIIISILLVALGVFFKFLIEPVYDKYKLASCLDGVEKKFNDTKDKECVSSKEVELHSCLIEAQRKIYCEDKTHYQRLEGSGLLSGFETCNNVPDNSSGYWNNNSEYQQLAKQCQQKIDNESCKLPSDFVKSFISYREEERNFCLKQF